ncbi:hypothetical protein FD755_008188 [Muntiacus reevesi]|uniref:SH2 domain-containing protein n=1 Tax=Muntiacus reevesi TaxID=9886 RepID=A0A5J5MJL2_MUNRE|nr:hypothetical protein FD755_008188 [Muntiacus reevesi]
MVAQEPALANNFRKEESLFGSCYRKEVAGCDLHAKMKWARIDPRASLLGTLKRPLSAKQKDVRPPRPVHSTSPCGHNYSPAPWPLRPAAAEEMCVQMEVQGKALVHSPDPGCDLRQADPARPELPDPLGSPVSPAGGLRLGLGEHDLIRSTVPLDGSSPEEVSATPPPAAGAPSPATTMRTATGGRPADGPQGVVLQSLRGSGTCCHFNFDPSWAPRVARVCDSVQSRGPTVVTGLTEELKKLAGKLVNVADGSFLLRESSDGRSLLSKSFRSHRRTLHTRMEHSNGRLSLDEQLGRGGTRSTVDLIERSIGDSENRAFWGSGSRLPGSATHPVALTNPGSRFLQLRPLQGLRCFHPPVPPDRPDPEAALSNEMKHYLQKHPRERTAARHRALGVRREAEVQFTDFATRIFCCHTVMSVSCGKEYPARLGLGAVREGSWVYFGSLEREVLR